MKKKIVALLVIVATLISCDSVKDELQGVYNVTQCKYSYKSVSDPTVGSLNLSKIDYSNPLNYLQLAALLTGSDPSVPLSFNLNVNVNNPNESAASLSGLEYILSIDNMELTRGRLDQPLNVPAGETQVLPLLVAVDIATLIKGESKATMLNFVYNLAGLTSIPLGSAVTPSNIKLQLKPSIMVANIPIPSPSYIPVEFTFGGK